MKVLLVDDSRAMRMIVKRTLRSAGYDNIDLTEAANGREALAAIDKAVPDLVLTDWNMPEMSGAELLEALKGRDPPVRAGVISSESSEEMREQASTGGALFLITKPFTADTFRQHLDSYLGGGGAAAADSQEASAAGPSTKRPLPSVKEVATAFSGLFPRPAEVVEMRPPKMARLDTLVIVTYTTDDDSTTHLCLSDLKGAATLGAALSLIPAGVVAEGVRAKSLPTNLQENAHEVFNVLASLLRAHSPRPISLKAVRFPGTPAPEGIASLVSTAKKRLDFNVTIRGYDAATMAIVVC